MDGLTQAEAAVRLGPASAQAVVAYCNRKSRKNDFRSLGGATGLPLPSKPVFCACSCVIGVLAPGVPSNGGGPLAGATGGAAASGDAAPNIGPGGGSGGPLRPHAAKLKAAAPSTADNTTARTRLLNRIRAKITPNVPLHTPP
jgi:hypothetical protein